jgi:DNA-binding CsgD family transcriptional regulator
VLLFVQRAQAVKPDFALTSDNAAVVAEICVRLDGLPLALELAAARVKILSPKSLLALLTQPLMLLTHGAHDMPERQQTLRATIEWSHNLLTPQEQIVFRRFAVFADGCTLDAAGAVCFGDAENTVSFEGMRELGPSLSAVIEVLDSLAALVEKNLLTRVEQEEGSPRFKMLELIRQYALEHLEGSGESVRIRRRHLAYYIAIAEAAEPKLASHEQLVWLAWLEREHCNLRAALSASSTLPGGALDGLRLASALWWFWYLRGYVSDWRTWLDGLLSATAIHAGADVDSLRIRATASYRVALLHCWWNNYPRAIQIANESLRLARMIEDLQCLGWTYFSLSEISTWQGDGRQGRMYAEEGLRQFRSVDDNRGTSRLLIHLGWLHMLEGDYAEAIRHIEEGLADARALGDRDGIAGGLYSLGTIAQAQGDLNESVRYFGECLQHARILDSRNVVAETLTSLGTTLQRRGALEAARIRFAEGLALAEKLGRSALTAYSLAGLAADIHVRGQPHLAAQLYGCAQAQFENYLQLLDAADRSYHQTNISTIRAQLGEQTFTEAYRAGSQMMPAQALEMLTTSGKGLLLHESATSGNLPAGLTQREVDVLRLLAQGLSNAQIAERLILSPFTVNAHLRNIYNKIGTSVRGDAIHFAREHDLL